MPYNGAGTFTLTYDWQQDKLNGIKIRADRMMGQENDIATGLSTAITRDGQSPATANLPLGGFKITGLGPGTDPTDAMQLRQFQNNDGVYVEVSGTDAYLANPSPAWTAYVTGQHLVARFSVANTTTGISVNVSGLGIKSLTGANGAVLPVGSIPTKGIKILVFNGTSIEVTNPTPSANTFGLVPLPAKNSTFQAVAGFYYPLDSVSLGFTVNYPSVASVGDMFGLGKYGNTQVAMNISGLNYYSSSLSFLVAAGGVTILYYTGATVGWIDQ